MNTKTEKKKDMGRIAKNTIVVVFSAIFFAFTGKVSAGDYRIYFTGTGDTNIVDSVRVQNLAQGTKLTLKGTEVLHLVSEVKGIKTVNTPTGELKVYPNPARETINVDFPATGSGPVQIDILGLSGIILAQKTLQVQEAGTHRAMITDLSKGSYLLKVSSGNTAMSMPFICTAETTNNNPLISYLGPQRKNKASKKVLKSTNDLVPMQYNDGERLLLRGMAGNYARVLTYIATKDDTIDLNFVACTDADSNHYGVVTIGTQTWMAENLKTARLNDGTPLDYVYVPKYHPEYWKTYYDYSNVYTKSIDTTSKYGFMYNYWTVNQGGICPLGWHLPDENEWDTLIDFVNDYEGYKLRVTGDSDWISDNSMATNEFGFSVLPAGSLEVVPDFIFDSRGFDANFWTSTTSSKDMHALQLVFFDMGVIQYYEIDYRSTASIRCIKD